MAQSERSYHHGDLPEVLMNTALSEIDRVGVQNLSLRALARAAGVSATAPYRHFPSKRCLLAALATRGFKQLDATVQREMALLAPAPEGQAPDRKLLEQRLIAMGLAYLAFAEANPTSYQLMFGAVVDDFSDYEMLQRASSESFGSLQQLVSEIIDCGGGRGLSLPQLCGAIWSMVHGMADLLFNMGSDTQAAKAAYASERSAPQQAMLAVRRDPASVMRALIIPLIEA